MTSNALTLAIVDSQELHEIAAKAGISAGQARVVLAELAELHPRDVVRMVAAAKQEVEAEQARLRKFQEGRAKRLAKKKVNGAR